MKFGYCGIRINRIHSDNDFDKVMALIIPFHAHVCGHDEHAPNERYFHGQKSITTHYINFTMPHYP